MQDLLDQVLFQTAMNSLQAPPGDAGLRKVLANVAELHHGQLLELDPVVVDLVHATLASQFPLFGSQQRNWRAVSEKIARVLWDDPTARERLQKLWNELSVPK